MGMVTAVCLDGTHRFSKVPRDYIRIIAGVGVDGDAHAGETVKHRSRVRKDPTQPNLRQVHLIHAELHDELVAAGFAVAEGDLGENITTRGVPLLELPVDTKLHIGSHVILQVTGLRNPCSQLDQFSSGLMAACLDEDEEGNLVRKSGIMTVALTNGEVRPRDDIRVELPPKPHRKLRIV